MLQFRHKAIARTCRTDGRQLGKRSGTARNACCFSLWVDSIALSRLFFSKAQCAFSKRTFVLTSIWTTRPSWTVMATDPNLRPFTCCSTIFVQLGECVVLTEDSKESRVVVCAGIWLV